MATQSLYITNYCRIQSKRITNSTNQIYALQQGTLNDFLQGAYEALKLDYPKYFKMDRLSKLGLLASEVLVKNQLAKGGFEPESVAIILANSHGSLDTDLKYQETLKSIPSPSLFVYTLPNIVTGEICIRHGIKGEGAFFVMEHFNPAFMTSYITQVFDQSEINYCIAGWVDVLDEHHDVFLYLVQRGNADLALEHSVEQVKQLYTQKLWSS